MKLQDINQKLTERPGGFGSVMKAKAKKQLSPFMKQRQQAATDDERLIKVAREMKKSLQGWMAKAFRSTGGAKADLTMSQFLGWVKKSAPKYAKGIEAYARGEKAYAQHFSQAIDSKGKQSSTASDPKVKPRGADNNDEADSLENELNDPKSGDMPDKEEGKQGDLFASDGEDKEPKSDTSASIYEARLRAILEADEKPEEGESDPSVDVGVNKATVLKDNEIDTLITMGIEKQIELDGGESIIDDPSELASQGVAKTSSSGSDAASNLDDNEIGRLKEMLDELGTDIFNAIRQQDGIENDVKKQLADNIQSLVDDIALDSF